MKTKLFAAAIAALTLGAALPASAHDFRAGADFDRQGPGYAQDWRRHSEITVRTQRGQFTVDRGDRLFWRLTERPYRFRPGFTYIYTDRCNRDGCLVLEFNRYERRPTDRFFAPYVRFERTAWNSDYRWGQDNRDWRGGDNRRDFDRRADSRDFRGDDQRDPRLSDPRYGSDRGQFNGNGYQGRNSDLLGAPY